MKKYLFISFIILFLSLTLLAYFCIEDNNLIPQGNEVVQKIESFKLEHKRLPTGLSELGIEEKMEGPFYYVKWDSINYMLYFGTAGVGESMNYYSDTKEWTFQLRGMGEHWTHF